MAVYPGDLPVYNDLKIIDNDENRGELEAGTTNPWLAEIVAIATELGKNVAGSATDLLTRLAISLTDTGKLKLFQICTNTTRPDPPALWMIIVESDTGDWYQCTKVSDPLTWKQLVRLEDVADAISKAHTAGSETQGGDVSGTVGAAKVIKVQNKTFDAPVAGDDGKVLYWNNGATKFDYKAVSGGALALFPLDFSIVFATDYTGNLHFQVQVSENSDYSAPVVDKESKDAQTDWIYDNGVSWVAVPSGGIDVAFDGHRVAFKSDALKRDTLYYVRVRQWQVDNSTYSDWLFDTLII